MILFPPLTDAEAPEGPTLPPGVCGVWPLMAGFLLIRPELVIDWIKACCFWPVFCLVSDCFIVVFLPIADATVVFDGRDGY